MTTASTLIATATLLLGLVAPVSLSAAPISYQYDALHRLSQVVYPEGTRISYGYDPAGNRTQKTLVMPVDTDGDGIPDATDNCPATPNLDQANFDGDAQGDACDADDDNDGHNDAVDVFPLDPSEWLDTDGDGTGNNADPDDDNDGVPDENDIDPLDPTIGGVRLNLAKTDASDPVQAGSQLTYTIDYANDGSSKLPATHVALTELYDTSATFVSANPMPSSGHDTWNLPDLAPGASGTITVTVEIARPLPTGTELTNQVKLESDQAMAIASQSTRVESQPVLRLTKGDSPDPVGAGAQFVYTLTYSNESTANETATGVVLTESYDPNTAFVSANPAPSSGNDTWQLGSLQPGQSGQIAITMEAASPLPNGTQLTNRAGLSSDQGAIANAEETTTVQSSPLLSLAKSDSPDPVQPGQELTYVLTYGNDGSANAVASNVVLRETYDPNVAFVSAQPAPSSGTDQWSLPDLHPGGTGSLSIQVRVNSPLPNGTLLTNIAVIESDQGAASASASTLVNSAPALHLEATDDPDPVLLGGELVYELTYGNATTATSTATDTLLRMAYDPSVSFLSADPPPDAGTNNQWTLGELSPGEEGALAVHVRVNAGNLLTTRATIESHEGSAFADVVTSVQPAAINQFAVGEIAVAGTVAGDYRDTQDLDGISETITERSSGGAAKRRYSYLEHQWLFDVQPGVYATVTASVSRDGDRFELAYSTDGVNFTPLLEVGVTTPGAAQQIVYPLPNTLNGRLTIRVRDTNRSPGTGGALDSFGIDRMYVRTRNLAETPPAAPFGLSGAPVSASQINLNWGDASDNEDGFRIERYTGAAWVRVGSTGAGTTSYQDTGLSPNTTFRYRVRAYNGAGESDPSNETEATTPRAISLRAMPRKGKAANYVDLTWSGATGANVEIRRDRQPLLTVPNSAAYTDLLGKKPNPSYVYQVCEVGITAPVCSSEVVVNLFQRGGGELVPARWW